MSIPDFKNRSADQIASAPYTNDSSFHIYASLSWCDYAQRNNAPTALHYAGIHLRMGVEQLWFEVMFAASGGSLTAKQYEEAVNTTTKLYKLIDEVGPHYQKFAEFNQIIASIDSIPHPPTAVWDIVRLKRIHGECGGLLLHFQGVIEKGYRGSDWIESRTRFVYDSALWIWKTMTTRGNLAVFRPDGLKKPEVFELWEKYRDGKNTAEDARIGLRLIQEIMRHRPHEPRLR